MKNVKAEIGKESMKPTEIINRNKERRGTFPSDKRVSQSRQSVFKK